MTVIDTSFLVALHDEDDRFHSAAAAKPLWGDRFLIPREIWAEFCQVLMRVRPPAERRASLHALRQGVFDIKEILDADDLARLAVESDGIQKRLQELGHRPLTLYDLVVLSIAARYKEKVDTYDGAMMAAIQDGLFPGARVG